MWRRVFSILAGYVAMFAIVMITFMVVVVAPDFAFRPNTAEASTVWIIYTLIASFIAAIVGGAVTAKLAKSQRRPAVIGLAALVFVLGILSAMGNATRTPPGELPPEVINDVFKRAEKAVQPTAYAWTVPFVGAAGALIGGGVFRRPPQSL